MDQTTLTRRERLRAQTTQEITDIALRQMATEGPGAISLRGIAREMGMTARAIYSYFPTRDDLVSALIRKVGASLADALETACDDATTPSGKLLAWGHALREWALANPQGFRLIYGDPVPGYTPLADENPIEQAARRICGGLNRLVAHACPPSRPSSDAEFAWTDFPETYLAKLKQDAPDLSPDVVALALRSWGRLHGLVTLEIFGHLGSLSNDPAAVYRAELLDIVRSLTVE
ncbi:TetR/AcrR family transcriptional regulator [Kibdelosporangium aridum]|uniref:TetR/AcrR family transcriptional regulator n=1 Tax=Kibdelosporangium aridum TaxID=2030 RepID=A0A428YII8_KIBAR|nr:TetR/AcrR family transcriptional regulator [Kibdelosporangium aridum]RSM67414.1 TetR/AcrR family transcriptional regulator [Kibdelosporangium aridum]